MSNLEALKAEATKLGITFSPNIGVETLSKKVSEHKLLAEELLQPVGETQNQRTNRLRKSANEMMRVEITCLNAHKAQEQGTWAIGSNSIVGTIREYVPFNYPWHITRMSYNILKEREFTQQETGKRGEQGVRKLVPELNITVLEKLTVDDLAKLARAQEANKKLEADQG